jgi:O-antigen/teichoic acid export membrane protein
MSNWRGKSLWSVSSRFVAAGFAFLVNVLLTRALSKDDVGHFFLSLSIAWGGALVCQWGASILAVKWVAMSRARGDSESVRSAVWSLIFFTLVQAAAVSIVILFLNQPLLTRLIWISWMFAVALQNLMPELIRGFDDLKWASILSGPLPQALTVAAIGIGVLFVGKLSFEQAASFSILANFGCSAVGLAFVARRAPFVMQFKPYKSFFRESTPIALSLAATYLLSQADLWVCGYLLPREDVAIYGIAQRFVAFVSMPMMIFGSVVTPKMAELLATREWGGLQQLLHKGTFLTTLFAFAVFMGGVLIGYPVMRLFFGDAYGGAYPLFVILGTGQVLHAMAGPNGYVLLLSGEQSAAMVATLIAAASLIGGAFLGAHYFGAPGVAAASSVALFIQTLWMWYEVRKRLKIFSHFRFKWEKA